ncbi:MAG: MFS transporter [Acidimicrobiia bacterium]|nr:MFS transporter [Acidimicrobiia bacterium]
MTTEAFPPPEHTHEHIPEPGTLDATPSSADAPEEAPAPTGARRVQVSAWPMWVLGLVIFIDQVDQNILRGVVTPLKHDLGIGDLQIGILLTAYTIVNGLITVPAGYLADRWNRSRTIGHTIVAWSGLTALTAAMPTYGSLLAIRSALGFGQAVTEPSAASLVGDYYPQEQRGRAFSVQQCLLLAGIGAGIGIGGVVGATLGWRAAFLVVGTPGVLIAVAVYRLREPARGEADRLHLGLDAEGQEEVEVSHGLFEHGWRPFVRDLMAGLRADARTILGIPTMRYALIGVSALLFTINAIGAALPQFYERDLGVAKGTAEALVGLLVVVGGIPGVMLGGRLADRFMTRVRGARMAIPAYCLLVGSALFFFSYLWVPFAVAFPLELLGIFVTSMAVPALRAGLTDAVPANLRGAGFGFFNLASIVFGGMAPLLVFGISQASGDLRTSFLVCSPPIFAGALVLLRARDHLDEDAARIFQAILTAMQQQAREGAD